MKTNKISPKTNRVATVAMVLTGMFFSLVGCDSTYTDFTAPEIQYVFKDTNYTTYSDSIKNQLKGQIVYTPYTFNLQETGESKVMTYMNFSLTGGEGVVQTSELSGVVDSRFNTTKGVYSYTFRFVPRQTKGNYEITFTPYSQYNIQGKSIKLNLVVFDNLLPIAALGYTRAPQYGTLGVILDGSGSKDRDERFNGKITTYEFTVQETQPDGSIKSHLIRTPNATTPCVFGVSGNHSVTLVVYDNDGAPSEPKKVTINLN